MANYINNKLVETIKKNGICVELYRCEKEGTKRVFFYPLFEGKRITGTMWGAKWEAVKLAKLFLQKKASQAI